MVRMGMTRNRTMLGGTDKRLFLSWHLQLCALPVYEQICFVSPCNYLVSVRLENSDILLHGNLVSNDQHLRGSTLVILYEIDDGNLGRRRSIKQDLHLNQMCNRAKSQAQEMAMNCWWRNPKMFIWSEVYGILTQLRTVAKIDHSIQTKLPNCDAIDRFVNSYTSAVLYYQKRVSCRRMQCCYEECSHFQSKDAYRMTLEKKMAHHNCKQMCWG